MGQLRPGTELIDALTSLCEEEFVEAGQVRVSGALEHVELTHFDPAKREYQLAHQGGPAEIASMHGTIATIGGQIVIRLDALVLGQSSFGAQLVTGQVRSAKVSVCEFVLEVFEDLKIVRGMDAQTGRTAISTLTPSESAPAADAASPAKPATAHTAITQPASKPAQVSKPELAVTQPIKPVAAPPAAKPETVGASLSWGDAIAESEKAATPASKRARPTREKPDLKAIYADVALPSDEDERPLMKSGDFLDHPKLGRCRIMKVEDDEEYAHVRLPRGKIRKLVLEIFEIQYNGQEEGRDVFALRIPK